MSAEPIDFDDIKWGSLTKQLQAFNRKNRTKMNLESFSKHILANPTKFIERSKDRARFYLNVIKPRAKKGGALSSHVMSDLLAQSYETKNKKKRRTEIDGFHIDPSLSGERAQVWYNPTTKQAVVVHRGTASFQDVMTDARLFFGDKSGKRFRHADNIQKKAEAKYGKAHVSTIGHSLGSSVAEKVGQGSKEVLTLNKPTTLEDLAKGKKVSEKQTDVRTKYDPVSILRPYQKGSDAIEIESTTWNPLAEHKTDTLKRLDEDVMIGRGKLGMMMRGGMNATEKVALVKRIRPNLNKENAIKDFESLKEIDCSNIKDTSMGSRKGATFVDFFTMVKRLETQGNKSKTFYDVWREKSELSKKRYINNLLNYYKKNPKYISETEPQIWLRIFNMYFGAINIFKPIIAMDIYCRFKPKSVLDFTMGWGGRLVGACALNVPHYIGIDLNKSLERPYEDMVKELKQHSTTKITLMFKSALDVDYSKLNYDCVLTSPPYYNIEKYEGQEIMDKDTWDKEFYEPLFTKTWRHIKKGGHYCLNVPAEVYERVCLKVLGKPKQFIPMYKNKRTPDEKYKEFIYVWVK